MIITLSRQTGAGARLIGARLGERFGVRVIDVDIRSLVAQRLGTSEDTVIALDERLEPGGIRILHSLGAAVAPETGVALGIQQNITAGDVEQATREVLLELASRESLVIIGRGGRWVLGDRPDTLHVRLVAPIDVRVERYLERESTTRSSARTIVRATDRARAAHVLRYFQVDWNDPHNYHLVLNTGLMSISTATDLIAAAAERLQAR